MRTVIFYAILSALLIVGLMAYMKRENCQEQLETPPQTERIYVIPQHKVQDMLGFANYCLELDILEPNMEDLQNYYKQGGSEYYYQHIKNATK